MAEYGLDGGRLAELACHGHVLRMIELLSAKEDALPLQERVSHFLQLVWWQRLGEVDTADFGADMKGEGYYFDACVLLGPGSLLQRRRHLLGPSTLHFDRR